MINGLVCTQSDLSSIARSAASRRRSPGDGKKSSSCAGLLDAQTVKAESHADLFADAQLRRRQRQSKLSVTLSDKHSAVLTAIGLGARFISACHSGNK